VDLAVVVSTIGRYEVTDIRHTRRSPVLMYCVFTREQELQFYT